MKFITDITTTFLAHVLNFSAGLLAGIIIARSLGPEKQGTYALIIFFPLIITTMANMGMARAIIAFLGRVKNERQELYGNIFSLGLAVNLLAVSIGAAIIVLFQSTILPGVPRQLALFSLTIIPFQFFFYQVFKAILLAEQKVRCFNLVLLAKGGSLLLFVILMLPGLQLGIGGAVAAQLSAHAAAFLISAAIVFGSLKIRLQFRLKPSVARAFLSFGLKTHLNNSLNFLQLKIDLYLLNVFLNPLAVGHYAIASYLGEKLWVFSQTTNTVLFPRLVAITGTEEHKRFTPAVTRAIFLLTIAAAILLGGLASGVILLLYGADYLPAAAPLRVLLIGVVAVSVSRVLSNDIDARGRPMLNTYVSGLALGLNLILNLIMIPRHGMIGAAWASSLSYSIDLIFRSGVYCRLSGNSPMALLIKGSPKSGSQKKSEDPGQADHDD